MAEDQQLSVVTVAGSSPGVITGRIFDIQRFSIHDGPGIRTTIFLKGCPLRCVWCHNPEGTDAAQAISFLPDKCLACGECVRVCEHGAHSLENEESGVTHRYDRERCEACGRCVELCDARALEAVGRSVSVDEVMKEVLQDRPFYASSGGGVSISGGEPLAQIDFTLALLLAARDAGIHRCMETSGFASWPRLAQIVPFVDLFLFDFKEIDSRRHAEFTGQSNEVILANLRRLYLAGARIQLQCPIIPGFNDRDDHIDGIAELARSMPNLVGVQLLPYHPLGKSKLERFGFRPLADLPTEALPKTRLGHIIDQLRRRGVRIVNGNNSSSR